MPNTYVALKTETIAVATPSITFDLTGISGYTDLVLVGSGTIATGLQSIVMRFNGDTGSNYSFTYLIGNGTSAFSGRAANTTFALAGICEPPTISNFLVQIQNYSNSTTYKTVLSRRNLSASFVTSDVSVWRNTAAITSITLFPENSVNFAVGSTFNLYGIANADQGAAKATGGIITEDANYWYHTFAASGVFTPKQALTCDYLVIAGGGGGGSYAGGGGGAGGYLTNTASFTTTNYNVTIGGGGNGGANSSGTAGSNSVFGAITATGGGYGAGAAFNTNGGAGGSGGGTSGSYGGGSGTAGAASPAGQGNAGGASTGGTSTPWGAAGGGGAGAVGASVTGTTSGGNGGAGLTSSISGFSTTYAGGGGGGADPAPAGTGGAGGGGAGGVAANATAGTANTGGGGGGVWSPGYSGGKGGSGLVIVRYAK